MKPPQFLLLLLMLAYTPLRSEPSPGLRAGTGVVDVSPEVLPFQLRSGSSEYIHDPLHARSIALQSGSGRTLITLLDDIGVSREMTDAAKVAVAAKTGWKSEEMLISGTHTHTAPKGGDTSEGRIAYEKRRLEGLVEAMTKAIESLEPAEVGYASDEESSEVHNRRWHLKPGAMKPNPFGTLDEVMTNAPCDQLLKPAGQTDQR